ncbi:gliding motility protein GldN [Tellurirhabdus rosea]|uniref:gliding motility protein GldN n=1 Tax=Tellurirhabdus rosea TaxID=2674997 RepID=UPI002258404C|nr:gliding motility protein GldN [Tellurirhabdus rosea]
MKQVGKVVLAAVTIAAFGGAAQAQEKASTGTNPLSVREINENDIMMKRTLWRRIDLKEKQNRSMFSKNNEITRYILEAVKAGVLTPYESDSVSRPMDMNKFRQKLIMPNTGAGLSAEEIAAGFKDPAASGASDGWGAPANKPAAKPAEDGWGAPAPKKAAADDGWGTPAPKKSTAKKGTATAKNAKGKKPAAPAPAAKPDSTAVAAAAVPAGDEYFANEFSILELKEDWVFDRKRSRLYYDIQTVGLVLPADKNPAGLEVPVAYFKYKDLDQLFRSDPKKYIWYNPQNQAQHKNLADAFDLRLFYGRITKYSNAEDKDLITMFGDKEGLNKSQQAEYDLMEAEHGLWEY